MTGQDRFQLGPQCQLYPCLVCCCREVVHGFDVVLNSIKDNGIVSTFENDECQQQTSQSPFDMGIVEGSFENQSALTVET